MFARLLLAGALALAAAAPAFADAKPDPIDTTLDACLGSKDGQSTYGMSECLKQADAAWDRRLNVAYSKLMKTLDPGSRALLQTAQRSWLDYRNKDLAFAAGPWRADAGTLAGVTVSNSRLAELRARALALESYADGS